jgi:prepilin-type processing-associated H-X9-DG protein
MLDLSRAEWRKSTRSGCNGCISVAFLDGHVAVRDSKDRHGPVLVFTLAEWRAFLGAVRNGDVGSQQRQGFDPA